MSGQEKLAATIGEAGTTVVTLDLTHDGFDFDYARCLFCGICVEVCAFEGLFWTPEFEYSEPKIADLLHDKSKLGEWMETVPDFTDYEAGSEAKKAKVPR